MRKTPTSSGKPSAKKVKKRNPWSDDESKSESDLEETEPVVIPRDSLLRRAAGIFYTYFIIFLWFEKVRKSWIRLSDFRFHFGSCPSSNPAF